MDIGTAARQAVEIIEQTHGNPSSVTLPKVRPIPGPPTTMSECRALEAWARQQSNIEQKATPEQIARHLSFIAATLPSKGLDEDSAKMRFAVYARLLEDFSNQALAFMSREVCERFDWFPTPKQCLGILSEYRPPWSEADIALQQCFSFRAGRFDAWIEALKSGAATSDEIGRAPERWRRIAVEQGHLRRLDDGSFVIRGNWRGRHPVSG